MSLHIRPTLQEDLPALKAVLQTIELFPADMLEEMIQDYLVNPDSQDIWFTSTEADQPVGLGYCAPEALTDRTFNLYAIGVRADLQGKRIGSQMMQYLESVLRERGHRLLIVDTSGTAAYAQTRQFYLNNGYAQVASIPDFWEEGDAKVVFWKKL